MLLQPSHVISSSPCLQSHHVSSCSTFNSDRTAQLAANLRELVQKAFALSSNLCQQQQMKSSNNETSTHVKRTANRGNRYGYGSVGTREVQWVLQLGLRLGFQYGTACPSASGVIALVLAFSRSTPNVPLTMYDTPHLFHLQL
jgi:hypothetical protein